MITDASQWDNDRWPNFKASEFVCKGSGSLNMDPDYLDKLQALRTAYGRPMVISSGYRSPEYNNRISSTGKTGPHTTGKACDIVVAGVDAYDLLQIAFLMGFGGIGSNQTGPWSKRFIHLDTLGKRHWTY